MDLFINITVLATAIWTIIMAFMVNAECTMAIFVFKALPFILGMASAFSAAKLWGWI